MNNAVCYSNGQLKAIEWENAGTNCPLCSTIHSTSQTRQASQLLGTKLCDLTIWSACYNGQVLREQVSMIPWTYLLLSELETRANSQLAVWFSREPAGEMSPK